MDVRIPIECDNLAIQRYEEKCIKCGQCANVCLVSSIHETYEYQYIKDEEKIIIFNTSPSVRIALDDEFGMEDGTFVEGKMVALLHQLETNYVLDTNFSTDLTLKKQVLILMV
ncbi:[Fe-Fe] hydrogenase large subunit C-terminal domain-containing protein [Candidatus Stoquefichus massiliensis]|uniref:[Fe-Fe] hydrogenase large subunit C-terminal domain-containing protein n=1 Tax=Candidatus Stoquefichus massiliensis TaxID=1470350 RepID=UPI000484E5C7|nr:[Fe-Fe] hydrogenase large subunit C-terminal domain-containing protein [Candidatus Stoquefichus massiliensis]